jgi:hypothetical protein
LGIDVERQLRDLAVHSGVPDPEIPPTFDDGDLEALSFGQIDHSEVASALDNAVTAAAAVIAPAAYVSDLERLTLNFRIFFVSSKAQIRL